MNKEVGHMTAATSRRKESSPWIQTFCLSLSHAYSHQECSSSSFSHNEYKGWSCEETLLTDSFTLPQDVGCKSTGISEGKMCLLVFSG